MSTAATLICVLFLVVVAPIWILAHYATRWRAARVLSKEQEQVLGELWETAQRMEERAENLERLLDAEAPGWRGRAQPGSQPGVQAGSRSGSWNKPGPWSETGS